MEKLQKIELKNYERETGKSKAWEKLTEPTNSGTATFHSTLMKKVIANRTHILKFMHFYSNIEPIMNFHYSRHSYLLQVNIIIYYKRDNN